MWGTWVAGGLLIALSGTALAATTNFGVRIPGEMPSPGLRAPAFAAPMDILAAARVAASFGRVTSTYRSVEHNRAVGGVPNSYHLRGRAVDIARRAGVSHFQIEAALRRAGYHLVESLDEGDHSHFAFAGSTSLPGLQSSPDSGWRVVASPEDEPAPAQRSATLLVADNHGTLLSTAPSGGSSLVR